MNISLIYTNKYLQIELILLSTKGSVYLHIFILFRQARLIKTIKQLKYYTFCVNVCYYFYNKKNKENCVKTQTF